VHIGIQHATEKSRLHVNALEANKAIRTQFEKAKRQLRLDVQERIKKNGGSPSISEVYLAFPFKLI